MRARDFAEKIRKITKSKEFYAEFQTDHTGIPAGPAALFGQKAPQRLLPKLCHHVPVERHLPDPLRKDAEENGKELWFFGLLPTEKAWLEANYPGEFTYESSRDDAEYIYEAEKLATYAGKKLHAKRNFCNRFEAAHPDWRFEPITAENMEAVLEFHRRWQVENEGGDEGLHKEGCVVRCALRELEELEMTGGVLTAGGKIYGFAIASMINETMMDENIEKADGEEPGAYPMVCREMAKMMKQKYPGLVFINREEDTGDEGLRRSKESYCPVMLLEKYVTREAK